MLLSQQANNATSGKICLKLAIVGAGRTCKAFLEFLRNNPFSFLEINVAGVCDINPEAEGLRLAKDMGIYTTEDFREFFRITDLDILIELTNSRDVLLELISQKPRGVGVLEHNISRLSRALRAIDQILRSARLQVTRERMASDFLIQQAKERIVALRPDFTIVEANEPYLEAVKRTKEEVLGAHCYEITHGLSMPCSSVQPETGCPLMETLRTGESAQVIHRCPAYGADETYCEMVTYPIKDQKGEISKVIEIWRDITEALSSHWEKRAKLLREDLNKMVQEDRMISLGKLVASSVHEINNPIQGLLTFSRLMEKTLEQNYPGPVDLEKFRKYLSIMSGELERCGGIVSGLLSFSRQSPQKYQQVDLNEMLKAVITLTRHKMELQGIDLATDLHPGLLTMVGDLNQLQQCFLNLIFNAIEAMPEGGRLFLSSRLDGDRKKILVEVQDTGNGIPEDNLDHIFDPFFTTKGEGKGTGLGLSIVYGIVKNHKGNIQVRSQVGDGSSFLLSFPTQ